MRSKLVYKVKVEHGAITTPRDNCPHEQVKVPDQLTAMEPNLKEVLTGHPDIRIFEYSTMATNGEWRSGDIPPEIHSAVSAEACDEVAAYLAKESG